MRFPTLKAAVAALLFAASCANPINLKTAENYYEAGLNASQQGNHYHGAVLFSRAWGNATMGRAGDAGMARMLYAYGRELALVGEFEEATEKLEESLRIQREVSPPTPMEVLRRLSLLGRIYLDTGRPAEALPLLRESVDMTGPPDGVEIPVADYMYLLSDLAKAAVNEDDLGMINAQYLELLGEHGNIEPDYPYERFTPEAVERRLGADLSPDKFKPQ